MCVFIQHSMIKKKVDMVDFEYAYRQCVFKQSHVQLSVWYDEQLGTKNLPHKGNTQMEITI